MIVGDFHTPLLIINRTTTLTTTKNEDVNTIKQTDPRDILKNTPPNDHRIDIFLKYSWNIFCDRPRQALKQASIFLKGFKSYKICSPTTMGWN